MARSLTFMHGGQSFTAALLKVDRSQLYGSVTVLTQDAQGRPCTVATLASDGHTLIPRGGTALGYINTEGNWISRDELQPVSLAGEPIAEVPSSFDAPIDLNDEVDATVFLDHSARLTYLLGTDEALPAALDKSLTAGSIYQFGFSYRGGVGHDPAFLFKDDTGSLWMLVTEANDVRFVSLEQAALCAGQALEDEIDDDEDEGDDLDFGML